ncbi:IS200/IS605 family accessory protein TnpB-related protein [Micromonospora yasonensis]|uniref:IS200/IS605 family accessory protein TnpB-related protein n=1 Tax=Micromonospora yasonensis TaxID=1128667 RepID=UPI0022312A85|nr:IS200/IS605 family accessory protein TnpB-related protein [Micromonospora yasonensis]MCW3841920.1 IS200/IS605 family accessory protein TnpB-related protein [Micromonospora yasonensis]
MRHRFSLGHPAFSRQEPNRRTSKRSTAIVREAQTVVTEDLSVRNMLRNRRLARVISDAAWSQFRSVLEYKAQWYGREVIPVDRWYPSSKTCSTCRRITTTPRPQRPHLDLPGLRGRA